MKKITFNILSILLMAFVVLTGCNVETDLANISEAALENLADGSRTADSGSSVECKDLGTANDYTLFIFEDITQNYTDSEGAVAAGGDVTLTDYGVGLDLTDAGYFDTLVVGGKLIYNSGQVHNGNVAYGTHGALNMNVLNGTARQDSPIDFASEEAYLKSFSAELASLTSNGNVNGYGVITFKGTDPELNVFTIGANRISTANTLNMNIPAGAKAVVNVIGTDAVDISYAGTDGMVEDRQNTVFNIVESTELNIEAIGLKGTVLAPYADVTFNNGHIDGTLVAKSLTGTGESHHSPLSCIPVTITVPTPTPTPTCLPLYLDFGTAADYNLFILEDLTQQDTDSEGAVAVGGDANLSSYGVGLKLTDAGDMDTLVVGGTINFNGGRVHFGNAAYDTAGIMNFTVANGTRRQATPIDFAAEEAYLEKLSWDLAELAPNGNTNAKYGVVTFTGTNPELNIFTITAKVLDGTNTLSVSIPEGASCSGT